MKKLISILMAFTLIFSFTTFMASAEKSPSGKVNYKITVDYSIDDKEPVYEYVVDGDTYTLIANTESESGNYNFLRWSIEGDYIIVSGSLDSPTLVIKPLGDLKIVQIIELLSQGGEEEPIPEPDDDEEPGDEKEPEEDKEPDDEKETEDEKEQDKEDKPEEDKKPGKKPQGDKNDSETSPPTGNNILHVLGGLFLTSLISCLAFKRLAK